MQFGPEFHADGSVTFHVHAPAVDELALVWDGQSTVHALERLRDGEFRLRITPPAADARYRYQVHDGRQFPDPVSRFQPDGVHGPSQLWNSANFIWTDSNWKGIPRPELILYELHLGTFTQDGTYLAAIDRLDELVELGVTAIEVMPVAQSAGQWNWGYDGVNFFAPRNTFGSPDDFRRLIDAAHARGLAVILDVVYNHFGPEGNYLHPFGGYVSSRHTTPWGDAPNFDGEYSEVARGFVLENVRYWLQDFHLDGLRLDATHCIPDQSARHIVFDIGRTSALLQRSLGRELHLIAESNIYDRQLLHRPGDPPDSCDALWCDDFIHSTFALLRPGEHRSSREYRRHSDFDMVMHRGYVFEGTFGQTRRRIPLDEDADRVDLSSLVSAIQNHDFIGNHPLGERLHQLTSPAAHRSAAAMLLLFPTIPMLFMGEEFAAENPFYFFVDFGDQHLREAVERGRREEHPQHSWSGVESALSEFAFRQSKLGPLTDGSAKTRQWYRDLIQLRKQWQRSGLLDGTNFSGSWDPQSHVAALQYQHADQTVFAWMRLHPADESPDPIPVRVSGNLILSQEAESVGDDPAEHMLGGDGVLIGIGTATTAG